MKTGLISWKLCKRSNTGLRLFIRMSSLIVTVTVSAAEDLQASGMRQQLPLKQKSSEQSIARCTGYWSDAFQIPITVLVAVVRNVQVRQGGCAEPNHRLQLCRVTKVSTHLRSFLKSQPQHNCSYALRILNLVSRYLNGQFVAKGTHWSARSRVVMSRWLKAPSFPADDITWALAKCKWRLLPSVSWFQKLLAIANKGMPLLCSHHTI